MSKQQLIPGGIYTMSEYDEITYFVFIENVPNTKAFTFFVIRTFENEYEKITNEIQLYLWLQLNYFKPKDNAIQKFYRRTEEEMLEMIDGFIGCVDDSLFERLKYVFELN